MSKLDKAVRKAWADEIASDLLEAFHQFPTTRPHSTILNEGWLSAAGKDFAYYVGVNDDELWAEVYKSEDDFENERKPVAGFRITMRVVPA